MKGVCVVIPVYKESPSIDEQFSIRQTVKVLGQHDLALVCPNSLNITEYTELASEFHTTLKVKCFQDQYFKDINGYNRLLLSPSFYQAFKSYKYILISQPDAYVFRDELIEWCDEDYDFIGAPLIGQFTDTTFSETMRVGNGGFSLRNVQTALRYFNSRKNVFSPRQAANRIALWKKPQTRIFVWIMMLFGWHNKPKTVANDWNYNEDDFWSGLLDNSRYALKKPSPKEALAFSFERFPSELYRINGEKLPFGCHAWRKYEYSEFWATFMQDSF